MTEKVNPSISRPVEAFKTAGAIALAGGADPGYISESSSPSDISVQDTSITEGNLNSFSETSGSASLDVTIEGGEAFVYGSWMAIDTQTTVTLAASTAGQTVYAGWNKDSDDDVIVGLPSAFQNASGNTDQKIPLFEYDTDGSGVTNVTDLRKIGYSASFEGELTLGANSEVTISYDLSNDELNVDGADLTSNGVKLVNESGGYIPQVSLENDSLTVTSGTSLTGGGSVSLGGSINIDHGDTSNQDDVSAPTGAAVTDINLNPQGHVTSIGTTDLDGRYVLESGDSMSGTLSLNATLAADMSGGSRVALPDVTSDPFANPGDLWYRSDLD